MEYQDWEQSVPHAVSRDALWKMRVYRLALFAADTGWHDVTRLAQDRRTVSLSDQLYRSLGSISANIAEGYSRNSSKDQARFFEYALGPARESRDWYYKARHVLGDSVTAARLEHLTQVIRLLLVIVPSQQAQALREDGAIYEAVEE